MIIYLGLGSNLGNREMNLRTALSKLSPAITVDAVSAVYETKPEYLEAQPKFLNIACRGQTEISAHAVLALIKKAEKDLGRIETERFGPRIIDIDLLFYGGERINKTDLVVPHSGIAERAFVLFPLADIAPDFVHPVLKSTIRELKEKLGKSPDIRKTEITI